MNPLYVSKGPTNCLKNDRIKKAKTLRFFGPTNGWACFGITKLKQILKEKPETNPETRTWFPPHLHPGYKVQTLD